VLVTRDVQQSLAVIPGNYLRNMKTIYFPRHFSWNWKHHRDNKIPISDSGGILADFRNSLLFMGKESQTTAN